jgi:hypothetical protein
MPLGVLSDRHRESEAVEKRKLRLTGLAFIEPANRALRTGRHNLAPRYIIARVIAADDPGLEIVPELLLSGMRIRVTSSGAGTAILQPASGDGRELWRDYSNWQTYKSRIRLPNVATPICSATPLPWSCCSQACQLIRFRRFPLGIKMARPSIDSPITRILSVFPIAEYRANRILSAPCFLVP